MNTIAKNLLQEFRTLSANIGKDPLQIQGAGGNTSLKIGEVMWVKASGMVLSQAENQEIFVSVNHKMAIDEVNGLYGDGTCLASTTEPSETLRPSIETTFHAALDHTVVVHTHSIATLTHAISPEGCTAAKDKLHGLNYTLVPYAKPGIPLTKAIMSRVSPETTVIILQNHGLICCGKSVSEVSDLIYDVEERLSMPNIAISYKVPERSAADGMKWTTEGWIARQPRICKIAMAGSYYPDHVVFLGTGGLSYCYNDDKKPAILHEGVGIELHDNATKAQQAMLRCLSDVLGRLPENWSAKPLGIKAEMELINWDAEKYRQSLASEK